LVEDIAGGNKLRDFEAKVLRGMFGMRRDEVKG